MKMPLLFCLFLILLSCRQSPQIENSMERVAETGKQDSLFARLLVLAGHNIPETFHRDSLAFLILPLQASCPACRRKAIDSIYAHKDRILPNHYIILSLNGGRKLISSFFKQENYELPSARQQIILDSTDIASSLELYDKKPTMYYSYNKKVLVKVASIPATVNEDLHHFFSGKQYGIN